MFFTGCRMFSPWQETYCQWLGFPLTECPSWNDSGGVYADHHHSGNGGDGDDVLFILVMMMMLMVVEYKVRKSMN